MHYIFYIFSEKFDKHILECNLPLKSCISVSSLCIVFSVWLYIVFKLFLFICLFSPVSVYGFVLEMNASVRHRR